MGISLYLEATLAKKNPTGLIALQIPFKAVITGNIKYSKGTCHAFHK